MGDTETVLLAVSVEVEVDVAVPLFVAVGELDGVPVPLCVAVEEPLSELEPVLDAEAPTVTDAVDDADTVLLPLIVVLAVTFPVPLPDGVAVPVGVDEGVTGLVGEAVTEIVPVLEADAPAVTEPVGLCDMVELALSVEVGVCDAVLVPDCVGVLEGVPVPVCVGVTEPLNDALPLLEDEAPEVREAVGLCERVELPLIVEDGVCAGVPVPD